MRTASTTIFSDVLPRPKANGDQTGIAIELGAEFDTDSDSDFDSRAAGHSQWLRLMP
jgi:hypothetical protein